VTPRPPRLATALLRRFGPDDDAIKGDLLEGFQRRSGSKIWYWWQVGNAIRVMAVREIQMHPVGVAVALTAGLLTRWVAWDYVAVPVLEAPARIYALWRFGYSVPYFGPFAPLIAWVIPSLAEMIGSAVAVRLYRGYRPVLVLLYATTVFVRFMRHLTLNSVYYDAETNHYTVGFSPLGRIGIFGIASAWIAPFVAALIGGMWSASSLQARASLTQRSSHSGGGES
jgi:hypothetical protein